MLDEDITIIIVENKLVDLEAIKNSLLYKRCNILTCITLQEYRLTIETVNPDIVLTNVNLPDGSVLEILEADSRKRKFPIVVMMSSDDEIIATKAIESGAIDYIVKSESTFSQIYHIADKTIREWQYINKIKQLEQDLSDSEYRYNLLSENVTDTVLLMDMNFHIQYISPSVFKVRGYTIEELNTIPLQEQMTQMSYKRFKELLNVALNSENRNKQTLFKYVLELELYKKLGSSYWTENILTIIFDDNNKPSNLLWCGRNITEYKNAEIQLQKQNTELIIAKGNEIYNNRLKSSFLANVSHEIRTPLNGILGFAEFLRSPNLTLESRDNYIEIINSCGKKLLSIITDIIEISKIETKQMNIVRTEINVNSLLNNIYSNYKIIIPKQNQVSFKLKDLLPANNNIIKTDETKLKQIISNLLDNAIKFTDSGSIEFGCKALKNNIEFYVKDSGIGIPSDFQNVIFDRFRKLEVPQMVSRGGIGLGLSICKSYVEILGGKIKFDSKLGVGTSFYFTIPADYEYIEQSPELPVIPSLIGKKAVQSFENKQILVAEDDDVNFLYIQEILSQTAATFIRAKNGKQAVELMATVPNVNLVLMDIKMPLMTGLEATIEIRKINKTVPIIAQTAYAFEEEKQHALLLGCNDYISKPIKRAMLISLIEKYINS